MLPSAVTCKLAFIKRMYLQHWLILFWSFCILPLLSNAQTPLILPDTVVAPEIQQRFPRYRLSQWGFSVNTLRDEALSPLLYQGAGIQWTVQYWKYKDEKLLVQNTLGASSTTFTNEANDNIIAGFGLEYRHTRLYPVLLAHEKMQLYLGGFLHPLFYIKLLPTNVNNAISYDILGSIGASGLWQYSFELFNRQFVLSDQLSIPLIALFLRPPFAWPVPTAVEEEGRLSSDLQWGSWNRYFSLTNQVSLNFYTYKKRRRQVVKKISQQLSYTWNYSAIPKPNLMQVASHTITYSRVLKMD